MSFQIDRLNALTDAENAVLEVSPYLETMLTRSTLVDILENAYVGEDIDRLAMDLAYARELARLLEVALPAGIVHYRHTQDLPYIEKTLSARATEDYFLFRTLIELQVAVKSARDYLQDVLRIRMKWESDDGNKD